MPCSAKQQHTKTCVLTRTFLLPLSWTCVAGLQYHRICWPLLVGWYVKCKHHDCHESANSLVVLYRQSMLVSSRSPTCSSNKAAASSMEDAGRHRFLQAAYSLHYMPATVTRPSQFLQSWTDLHCNNNQGSDGGILLRETVLEEHNLDGKSIYVQSSKRRWTRTVFWRTRQTTAWYFWLRQEWADRRAAFICRSQEIECSFT